MTPEEFEHIVPCLRPLMVRVGRDFFGNKDDAEDVAQESLARLWTYCSRLDAGRNMEALAIRVAKNVSVDIYKSRQVVTLPIKGKLQHMTVTEDAFDANEINKRIKYHYNQIEKNNNRLNKYVDSLADRLADSVRIDSVEIKPQIKIDSKAPKLQTLPYSEE